MLKHHIMQCDVMLLLYQAKSYFVLNMTRMPNCVLPYVSDELKINVGFPYAEYHTDKFYWMRTRIWQKVGNSTNRDVEDNYDAMLTWRTT
jgi:hypothetical protein